MAEHATSHGGHGQTEPAEMDYAQHNATYDAFLRWSKRVIVFSAVTVILMAIFLV